MGAQMSKPELRKRRALLPSAEEAALEEPLLEDYVHVTAPEEEEKEEEEAVPGRAARAAELQPARPVSPAARLPHAAVSCAALAGLRQHLQALWGSLLAACLRTWALVRGALVWCLSSLGLARPPQPRLSLVQQERLEALQERLGVPYDAQCPTHLAALRELWEAAFPGEAFPAGIKSERWKEMGWQSDDPGRDFRGAGFISLESLLFMAQRHEGTFLRLMRKQEGARSEWEYPFAAGGVNLAFMLSEALDLRHVGSIPATPAGRAFLPLLEDTDTAFEELFVASYALLDRTWLAMGASYMDFPRVLKTVRQQVERVLSRGVASMDDFQGRLLGVGT